MPRFNWCTAYGVVIIYGDTRVPLWNIFTVKSHLVRNPCNTLKSCRLWERAHLPGQWMLSTFQICRHHTHLVLAWKYLTCFLGALMWADKARTHVTADHVSCGLPEQAPSVLCCCLSCWPFVLPTLWFSTVSAWGTWFTYSLITQQFILGEFSPSRPYQLVTLPSFQNNQVLDSGMLTAFSHLF